MKSMGKARVIDGVALANTIKNKAYNQSIRKHQEYGRYPGLAVISVGEDPASQTYLRNKRKDCRDCNIHFEEYKFPSTISEKDLIDRVEAIGAFDNIDGLIVELPLPEGINTDKVLSHIPLNKDIDCMNPRNIGKLYSSDEVQFKPCTPAGVLKILKSENISIPGKDIVVVGRSDVVGKPLASMLTQYDATVTTCHSKTKDIGKYTRRADIVISCVGKPNFITSDMIASGTIIIDIGINYVDGKLCGDVAEDVWEVASAITPVPGGIGPMTRAMLMHNVVKSAENRGYNYNK